MKRDGAYETVIARRKAGLQEAEALMLQEVLMLLMKR